MKTLFFFHLLLIGFIAGETTLASETKPTQKPNVILIMADDLGYSGITSFGGIGLETPALDKLAANGVVCTNFHTNAPVCSPTRVSIMTGSYQQRVGLNHIYSETGGDEGLDPVTHPSFAKKLQEVGYRTAVFGKWHMGMDMKYNPTNHGFDEFRGFLKGNVDFISHYNTTPEVDWWHNKEKANEPGYATDLINKYAVDFVKESEGKPFFLYVPHAAIHTPIQGRNDEPIRTEDEYMYDNGAAMEVPEYQRRYREMIKILDEGVGMLIDELERQGIMENTLIIFTSDNGALQVAADKYPGANGYFNGSKATVYEGGTRVPAIFYYPEKFKHHRTDELMLTMDFMPTILEFCGIENDKKIDGTSLLPTLIDNEPMPERDVFWANLNSIAMRSGDWKLVWKKDYSFLPQENGPEPTVELFNMLIDPKEQHNLTSDYPEKTEKMKAACLQWWDEVTEGTELEGISFLDYRFKFDLSKLPASMRPKQN